MSVPLGLTLALGSAVGSAVCDFGKKRLSKAGVIGGVQVPLLCLLEGFVGLSYLAFTGDFVIPGGDYWTPALTSAALNAVTGMLLIKAYSMSDISLCAPFNAALPIISLLFSVLVLQDEPSLPPHRALGVVVIGSGGFLLARAGKGGALSLPPGAYLVLLNCILWSFTTKLDELSTRAAGKTATLCYGKLLTGLWAAFGSQLAERLVDSGKKKVDDADKEKASARHALSQLWRQPGLLWTLLGVALGDGLYMMAYLASLSQISKVIVVAIKKGGNLLVTSVGGMLLFGESTEGRILPVCVMAVGVLLMSV
jgi:drug/metabolite transporter (DMT)-like permease